MKGGDMMEKEIGQIKFIETDDGFRMEAKGKGFKDAIACGCIPMIGGAKMMKMECHPSEGGKMEISFLPDDKKKKE